MKHVSWFQLCAIGTSLLLAGVAQAQDGILQKDTTKAGAITFLRLAATGPGRRAAAETAPTLRSLLKLRSQDELRPQSSRSDELGFTHTVHAQYYKGIPVEYGVYVVHSRSGAIETLNGEVIKIGTLDATAKLSEKAALADALTAVGAKVYKWQVPAEEKVLQQIKNDPAATYYPKGQLLVSRDETAETKARLAYKFAIYAQQPASATYVYVDAQSGQVFRTLPIVQEANVPATAATRYSGTQAITTDQVAGNLYRLRETGRGNGATPGTGSANIETYTGSGADITNTSTSWSGDAALDAHWAAERTYDYFRSTFGWNSWNNGGATLTIVAHSGAGDDAHWDSQSLAIFLGDGGHANPYTALDVVGHELAHGYTQGLINSDRSQSEPLAINEGLSDIWGTCVEAFAAPGKQTWLEGEDILPAGSGFTCVRNLITPNVGFDPFYNPNGYPDTYQGARYDTRSIGGGFDPHINSTIISHCFYLLAVGGNSTNSQGTAYNVTGIGIAKAAQILFRAESNHYFTSTSGFSDVRGAMVQAASELYGSGSCEAAAVTGAWFAVGVGSAPLLYFSGPTQLCAGTTAEYQANVGNVTWQASPASLFTTSSGSGSYFATSAASGAQGTGTITMRSCGGTATRTVRVGPGEAKGYFYGGGRSNTNLQTYQFVSPGQISMFLDGPYTYTFTSSSSSVYLNNTSGNYTSFYLGANQGVTIRVTSSQPDCGLASGFVFSTANGPYGYGYRYAPNPANDELIVTATDADTEQTDQPADSAFDAALYDSHGRRVKMLHTEHGKAVIDLRDLPNGLYNLRAGTGKNALVEHIQVAH